jgi:hypothetical protein
MRQSLNVTELLPLKAFYLGFSLKDHVDLAWILNMVDESIEKCGEHESFQKRKVFYLLLKCELNRDTDNVIENRKIVKTFCEENNYTVFFNNYMKIVQSTLLSTKVVGAGEMSKVKTAEISDHERRLAFDTNGTPHLYRFDVALEGLGLDGYQCSEQESRFLYKVTLREMLDNHFGKLK